ncbi:MAG: NAD(P)/FAD-dependent oxidoreductase [Salinarimonas sp.]
MRVDLVVIGGGLIGLASAFEARRAGLSVLLFERDTCGRHASSASAGGVRSLNRDPAEIPLARAALPLWAGLAERLGADVGFAASGQIRVAEDETALAALEARAVRTQSAGWTHERMIGPNALFERVPALARHCLGALVVDDDGFADPLKAVHAYRRACLALGVEIREGVTVQGVSRADGQALEIVTDHETIRAGAVANCAGAWGGRAWGGRAWAPEDKASNILAGEPIPMRASALQMIVTAPVAPFVTPVIGCQGRKLSLKQTDAGAVVIGGAFEGRIMTGADGQAARGIVLPERIAANLANAVALFPHLRDAPVLRSWTGIEGMVEDGLPVIGESARLPGLVHAFGFSAHGFALAPLVGEIVRDLVTGQENPLPLAPFAPERFAAASPNMTSRKEIAHARA